MELTKTLAKKVLEIVDAGLVSGLGKPEPGKMCIEAAVNYAMGLPHGDQPECVGEQVRAFKISLNDAPWPTNEDRTKGLRKLAIAQLGSDQISQKKFLKLVGLKCMNRVLPLILRNELVESKYKETILILAKNLEKSKTYKTAGKYATEARKLLWDAYASDYAYASASVYASVYAYDYVYASASDYAYAYASDYAYASASVYASAYAYAKEHPIFTLKVLNLTADCALEALIELKSPGVKWLGLCK